MNNIERELFIALYHNIDTDTSPEHQFEQAIRQYNERLIHQHEIEQLAIDSALTALVLAGGHPDHIRERIGQSADVRDFLVLCYRNNVKFVYRGELK